MTWLSVAPYAAFAVLGGLFLLLGSRFRGLAADDDSRGFRLVVGALAGTVVFYLTLTALDLLRIPWHPIVLVALLCAATMIAHFGFRSAPRQLSFITGRRFGWGSAIALLAFASFAWLSVSLCTVTPDFYFHWGLKGERFFLARGTDFAFLAMPWNIPISPHYPTLLPDLYAATALLAGGFLANVMMMWSIAFFGLMLVAGREVLRRANVEHFAAEATFAITALSATGASMRGNMAGGADSMIALALVGAMPSLLRPPDRTANVQIAAAAAFAAASKVEGTFLAAALIAVQLFRAVMAMKAERRFDRSAVAALLLPVGMVALPWQCRVWQYHLSHLYYGGINVRHFDAIARALRYELTSSPVWHGFAYSFFLLPLLALARRLRPIFLVVTLQLLFYLYVYAAFLFDPVPLVIASFDRLELHLLPAILLAAGIALDSLMKWRRERNGTPSVCRERSSPMIS